MIENNKSLVNVCLRDFFVLYECKSEFLCSEKK